VEKEEEGAARRAAGWLVGWLVGWLMGGLAEAEAILSGW
jgi:hypothetical protein